MKKIMRKAVCAALALTLAAALLGGCSGKDVDPIQEMMGEDSGIDSSTVMFKVNDNDVTAGDLFFWLIQSTQETASYSSLLGQETLDWNGDIGEGMTLGDYARESAQQNAVLYNVVMAKADEYGYELTSQDKADYQQELDDAVESMGGQEYYDSWLLQNCLTDEQMEKLSSVRALYEHMLEGLFREGGEFAPAPEDLSTYAEENDLLCAKHILLLTQDMSTGEALSQEEIDAKKAQIDEMAAQLKDIEDPAELEKTFDKLMNANSEDTGLQANPDGYTFTSGQMVEEFENATRALEFGQVSDVVESSYGYHIILRLDPSGSETLRSTWAQAELDEMIGQWVEEASITDDQAFQSLDIAEFYDKVTAYQDSLQALLGDDEEDEDAGEAGDTEDAEALTPEETAPDAAQEDGSAQTEGDSGEESEEPVA